MRNRYFTNSLDNFEPHEVLEMLLYFSYRQGNTNELAHYLIDSFGSLSGVLNASPDELMKVKGVGEQTAMLLSMIIPIYRYQNLDMIQKEKLFYSSAECAEFLKCYFLDRQKEELVIMMFDNRNKLIKVETVSEGTVNSVSFSARQLAETLVKHNTVSVILAHNHPNGTSEPSYQDYVTTTKILEIVKPLRINLFDHIIVGKDDVSFLASNSDYGALFDFSYGNSEPKPISEPKPKKKSK